MGCYDEAAAGEIRGHRMGYRFGQCPRLGERSVFRQNEDIGAERAELGGDAALGIYLEIKEFGFDGGACTESEQNCKQSGAIGSQQSSNDAPEHLPIF